MEIAVVAGFAAFLGKYLEQQFNLSTSSANQLLGRQKLNIFKTAQKHPTHKMLFQMKSVQAAYQMCVFRYDSNPLCLSGHFSGWAPGEEVESVCIRGYSSGYASQYHLYGLLHLFPLPWL